MNFGKFLLALWVGGFVCTGFAAVEFKEAEITTLKNQVEHDAGSGAAPAKVNEKIGENSKVTTAASSMAELMFADTSITRLGANSLFSFQSKERIIKLDKGSILVNTPPGKGGATVDCGGVTGAVSGTTFMATRDVSGNVMFVMLEGSGVLKVTMNLPSGPVSKEIRPGQAASVGAASIKAAAESGDTPGGGSTKAPGNSAEAGEDGGKPAVKAAAPSIQVFDVDVKKIMETAPLIREFKTELPSMEKIEATIQTQQQAVKDGKLEKLEVEVVAVKEDGDVLVGSPKINPEDMKVVNRKEKAPDANLDIDTAAGGPTADAPRTAVGPAPSRDATALTPRLPPPTVNPGLVAGEVLGGSGLPAELPPTALSLTVGSVTITVKLDRKALKDRVVNLGGFSGLPGSVTMAAGSDSFTLSLDPAQFFPGFLSDTDPTLRILPIRAVSAELGDVATTANLFPAATIQAANPIRQLPAQPKNPADMAALDAYFYFQDEIPGVTFGPSEFFDPGSLLTLPDVALGNAPPVALRTGQDFVFHAAGQLVPGSGGDAMTFSLPAGFAAWAIYADEVSLGTSAAWTGLDWLGGVPPVGSLNYNTLNENKPYAFVYNPIPGPGEPAGYFDSLNDLYFPAENFPVWNDESGFLAGGVNMKLDLGAAGTGSLILAAGEDGFRAVGLTVDAQGGKVELQSLGNLELSTARVLGVGGTTDSDPTLRVEAKGTVKVGGATAAEQVRFEGASVDTGAGLEPMPGSLAVIRSETALELRNLTIRSFDGTRLEKTGADGGRILLSGSTVRDFKIKELTGMAVNADAKIQMMAVNGMGQLDGQLGVEGSLPVATKLAKEIDASVTGDLGEKQVHAQEIDLAAKQIQLNAATLTAMNSITARANTLIIQNSFLTVVRGTGMINFYVGEGLVNRVHNTTVANQLNFHGSSTFQIGASGFTIASSGDIASALTSGQMIETTSPQAGKVNVMPLGL